MMGQIWAAQPVCEPCWKERQPGRRPYRMINPNTERCCYCGLSTTSGIYVRERLDAVPFPTHEE